MNRTVVVLDTDVVVSLIATGSTHLLEGWPCYDFVVTDINVREFRHPDTIAVARRLVSEGHLRVLEIRDAVALERFAHLRKRLEDGESSVVAAVLMVDGQGLSNDGDAHKVARKHNPPVFLGDIEDLVLRCVQAGRLDDASVRLLQASCNSAGVRVPFRDGFDRAAIEGSFNCVLPELPMPSSSRRPSPPAATSTAAARA